MASGVWHQFLYASGVGVAVKVEEKDSRFVVTDLYLHSPNGITPTDLRVVPLGRYEQYANASGGHLERLRAHMQERRKGGEPTFAAIRRDFDTGRQVWSERSPVAQSDATPVSRSRLTRPGRGDPDGFYRAVAEAYKEYARNTRAAAVEIAKEAEVPVTTAHRWIREARRRGFLRPGQQGKTG